MCERGCVSKFLKCSGLGKNSVWQNTTWYIFQHENLLSVLELGSCVGFVLLTQVKIKRRGRRVGGEGCLHIKVCPQTDWSLQMAWYL